jgi:hypothetical protein
MLSLEFKIIGDGRDCGAQNGQLIGSRLINQTGRGTKEKRIGILPG